MQGLNRPSASPFETLWLGRSGVHVQARRLTVNLDDAIFRRQGSRKTFPACNEDCPVLKKSLAAMCGVAAALLVGTPVFLTPTTAFAEMSGQSTLLRGGRSNEYQDQREQQRESRRQEREGRQERQQEAAPADPEKAKADAQTALTATGSSCSVTEAKLLGQTAERVDLFEAVCATGPGYIVVASTPPQAVDCALLASQAETARAADPAADVGTLCTLPANQNIASVFSGYAREAGISCDVDEGLAIGQTSTGETVYEIGCSNSDGYWLEKTASGWTKTPCLQIMSQGKACRFTTVAEQVSDLQKLFTGTDASDCTVQQIKLMGQNANGQFIEAKCEAAGTGYIARIKDGVVAQVYGCPAPTIGGGCTLTTTPEADATEQ